FKYWKSNVRYSLTRQLEAMKTAAPTLADKSPAPAPAASASASVAGAGSLVLTIQGTDLDYVLKLAQDDAGKLNAVFVSPRSGEHKCKEASYKDGALRVEIEREVEGNNVTFVYEGKLVEGKLAGKVTLKE